MLNQNFTVVIVVQIGKSVYPPFVFSQDDIIETAKLRTHKHCLNSSFLVLNIFVLFEHFCCILSVLA